jgi:bifunctional UDP-N-acetylglucosamine pyrophosphorylase/glucosamine-1-phosphate N-acetyltransferase
VGLTAFPEGALDDDGDVVVVPGDVPLLRQRTLGALVDRHRESRAAATLVTSVLDEPHGWDRVVRGKNETVLRVIDQDEIEVDHAQVTEVATAVHCFRLGVLPAALRRIRPGGARREYPLSGIYEVLHDAGYGIETFAVEDHMEVVGVNDRSQLAIAEAELRRRINERWMKRGVTMWDPARTYVDSTVRFGRDVVLLPGVVLQGDTFIGRGSEVGPDSRLVDTYVGEQVTFAHSVANQASIGDNAVVGPFAVLGAGAQVPDYGKAGPLGFVSSDLPD